MTKIDSTRIEEIVKEMCRQAAYTRSNERYTDEEWLEDLARMCKVALEAEERRIQQMLIELAPSGRKTWRSGYGDVGRAAMRARGIRSFTGYGYGCDICHGADAQTAFTLHIGGYKGSLSIDLCRPCGERLANVVDARLNDGRRQRGKK